MCEQLKILKITNKNTSQIWKKTTFVFFSNVEVSL